MQRPPIILVSAAFAMLCTCGPTLTAYDPQAHPVVVDLGYASAGENAAIDAAPADVSAVAVERCTVANTTECSSSNDAVTDAGAPNRTSASVRRLTVRPSGDVASSGALDLEGGPDGAGEMSIVDGEVRTSPQRGRGPGAQPARVTGGHVVLQDPQGQRHEADVVGGEMDVRRDGPAGRHRARVASGRLALRELAPAAGDSDGRGGSDAAAGDHGTHEASNDHSDAGTGGMDAATAANAAGRDDAAGVSDGAAGSSSATAAHAPRRRRGLSPHEHNALDRLARAHAVDGGSAAAARQAAAARAVADNVEEGPPTFYGIPIVGHSLVVVIDVSYSMREPDPHAQSMSSDPAAQPSKLDMVRAQLVQFLASLPGDIAVDVIAFSSESRALWDQPRALDDTTLDQAVDWIAALRPLDETHPLDAVRRADAMHTDQIILLTDGRPTYADSEEPALLTFADSIPARNSRLDAVGIGPDQNAAFLDTLAARAHGMAVHL